jgi:predicted RNase H-like nuclease (RuvC/YqgF family)
MGEVMFGNELFDHWLNQKSLEILNKVEKEKISTEDMLILSLKAQTNHFHHMDQEFRGEFKKISDNFEQVDKRFKDFEEKIDKRFEQVDKRFEQMEKRFEQVDKRFEQVDKKFDRLTTIMMWQAGILVTLVSGLYLKLFFV